MHDFAHIFLEISVLLILLFEVHFAQFSTELDSGFEYALWLLSGLNGAGWPWWVYLKLEGF